MNVSIEAAIDSSGEPDARARIAALVAALSDGMAGSLPLGRKLIKLTVDAPPSERDPSAAIAASAGSRRHSNRSARGWARTGSSSSSPRSRW